MASTYTTSRDRDRLRSGLVAGAARHQLGLVAVSLVSMLAFGLCYVGRMRAFDATEKPRGGQATINLAHVTSADQLEPAMALAFENVADRRFASRELFKILGVESTRAPPANVGALARIQVPIADVDRTRGLIAYAARRRPGPFGPGAAGGSKGPALHEVGAAGVSIPLFTAADIAAIKPALVVRSRAEHRQSVFWCAIALLASFQLVSLVWRLRGVPGDRLLLAGAHLLTTLGFVAMLTRPDPLRDTLLLVRYAQGAVIALGLCAAVSLVNIKTTAFLRLRYVSLAAAVLLSVVLIVFGSGPGTSGAKVNLGPVQPIEAIRLLMAIFLAGYLGRQWELVRHLRETEVRGRPVPAWLNLPRIDHILPLVGGVGMALLLFFALRDLGPALLLSLMFLSLLAVARARLGVVLAGVAVLVGGFGAGYWLGISRTLTARVAMWQSPWENAVRGGDQIAHAIWSMATGSILGTGLGLGDTRYLPAGHTDLVLAAIGEELGAVGVLAAAAGCALIGWRGLRIARTASTDTAFFFAVAMTLSLVTPMLVMTAGMLGIVPLTGVATPFLSYGGSAMMANFVALGLLAAIASSAAAAPATSVPFRTPLRWLGGALTAVAVLLLVAWARVQVVAADRFLVEPQLSVQADAGRRFHYNPRVLDAVRALPRGSILDRRGVPLAAEPGTVRAAEKEYTPMRIALREACPHPQERCYPLGGMAFHLLGDEKSRAHWSATNTSYVERDAEDTLRGFDDRAISVRTDVDEDEAAAVALRRDYRDLVPMVRHRWEPDHAAVLSLVNRPRDVRLTIDARLQTHVAALTARSATAAGIQHAAVVVLDAESGELLASVSYPWPDLGITDDVEAPDALLDRARYGLYPPGSTFKLITAAAALRQDPDLSKRSFTCSGLPSGRVGARIPGYGRSVHDDVLDKQPHGTLSMHDGLVRSCNAYFGQLAVQLGARTLAHTAGLAGISYPTAGSAERVRENLPHAGYGQGPVLATPLRLARVAAAIGAGGLIREPSIVQGAKPAVPKPFLSEESSRLLASYMRDVVTDGTGRLLRNHAVHIAGKTGTAEVDGAASHAWFIGFTASGPAKRRIAFAVLLENAGYGGGRAADLAGQVVTAAAALGLVQ